ncbi:MAG: normocyte-binding protein [Clostridium sp.]|jgi:hypothetical protein|nr:normocyte-binding protein [Clostridium sp.]
MNLRDIELREVYRKWKKDLGEYRCFFRSTPFVSLKTYEDFTLLSYNSDIDKKLVYKVLEEFDDKYFVIVDLDFNEILDLSLELNNRYKIKPILNANLLFNDFGLIGDKINISKLIECGLRLQDNKFDKFIMFIPYDRYIDNVNLVNINNRLNNQYEIGFDDLPDEEMLKALGYKGIKIITKSKVKEDLMEYVDFMNKSIEVKLIKVE